MGELTNLELIHNVKEIKCQICKTTDEDLSYMVTVSSSLEIVEITCNDCWVKEIKKRLHETIDEEFE